MSGGWREDILFQLKRRTHEQVSPFQNLILLQNKLIERNSILEEENTSLSTLAENLKLENRQLEASIHSRAAVSQAADSVTVNELHQKLFRLQEELTEMHRRKGENAQQVIDLSAALKLSDKEISTKNLRIESLEAEMMILKQDLTNFQSSLQELESTNQLLKDEYQALQLALTTAETSLSSVKRENDTLVVQLMALKAKDADRMNLENDLFMLKKQQLMQLELAEAASEFRHIPETANQGNTTFRTVTGVTVPTKAAFKFEAHEGEVMCVQWDFGGRYFATAGTDRKIKVWEIERLQQAECKATLTGSNAAVMGVDFDLNGTMVLGASNDYATRVWTIDDCRLRHTLTGHSNKVLSAKFFGDATRVVSGSHDRTLKIWDLRSKACISTKFAGSSCNDVVTTEMSVISGHFDKKVRFWDIRSSSEPLHEVIVGGKVTSLDLTKDKNYLGICSRDDKLSIVDLRTNGVVETYSGEEFHVGCDWSRISFSPDGQYISAGTAEGNLYVWNVSTGAVEKVLRGHSSGIYAVSWHPTGLNILSVDKSKTCYVWSDM